MKAAARSGKKLVMFAVCLVAALGVLGFWAVFFVYDSQMQRMPAGAESREPGLEYPDVEEGLAEGRRVLLEEVRRQYDNPLAPAAYAEWVVEPWCADFASYVVREASERGAVRVFANPHSGSWRIPGVYTLKEYLVSVDAFRSADSGYLPQPGDLVLYDKGIFGTHVNFVVGVDDSDTGVIYTVGGNENNKIMLSRFDYGDAKYGVVGFGLFDF